MMQKERHSKHVDVVLELLSSQAAEAFSRTDGQFHILFGHSNVERFAQSQQSGVNAVVKLNAVREALLQEGLGTLVVLAQRCCFPGKVGALKSETLDSQLFLKINYSNSVILSKKQSKTRTYRWIRLEKQWSVVVLVPSGNQQRNPKRSNTSKAQKASNSSLKLANLP